MRPQKAGGMARQVPGKPLGAFQPDGVFIPACLSAAAETDNWPLWGELWGAVLLKSRIPQESRGGDSGWRGCRCTDNTLVLG